MAYINQATKKLIKEELDKVVPKDLKYTLKIRDHSLITMVIRKGKVNFHQNRNEKLVGKFDRYQQEIAPIELSKTLDINCYYVDDQFSGEVLDLIKKIQKAMNIKNWNRSDIQTDYFDVGYYIGIQVGEWEKPYELVK